ncbi:ATP-binding protein [Paracoccus sp. Ld10]|uniref:hybrid sensor histidine kinase/response regulator n=1 Tax=Paracoccus sp. Ld10 TaxID=649158 RepID=UPI00386CA0D8
MPACFGIAIVVMGLAVWMLQMDARRQIDEMGTAATDNTQWFLAQSEVEVMALQRAAMLLAAPGATAQQAQDLRRMFDIFYSRILTLEQGRTYDRLRAKPGITAVLDTIQADLGMALPAIDGDDVGLIAELPRIITTIDKAVPLIRKISLEGVRLFAETSASRHQGVARALTTLSLLVVPLFIVLTGSVVVLAIMVRMAGDRSRRIAAVSDRLDSLFEASIDAILVARPDGQIQGFNAAAQRIYGYDRSEVLGGDVVDLLTPHDDRAQVQRGLAAVRDGTTRLNDGTPEILQSTARHKSGRIIPVELSMSVARGEDGPLMVAFVRDVSRRAAQEDELIEARDRAVAGEQAKTRMIAVMSHEMRTPLNGILGLLDLLCLTELDDRQRQYIAAMEHSGRMLLGHVNDVLDTSRVRSGRLVLAQNPVDLRALVDTAVLGLQSQAQAAGTTLTTVHTGGVGGPVLGDAARLEQIVVNLVGNAIKFTENGQITVHVDRTCQQGTVELSVTDTGIGIPAADLDRIFDAFVTLGSTFDRKVEGTGLGLSIVKGLVDTMGGQIAVTSEPGSGTSFRVTLPLQPAFATQDKMSPAAVASPECPTLSVLLVEDNAINRLVAREMLRRQGCEVTEAEDGLVGVTLAGTRRFDLILMDISMPRLHGVEAALRIRAGGPNRDTSIVALTAHAMPEDLARFQAAGMDKTLVKPLSRAALGALLQSIRPPRPLPDA